MDKNIAEKEGSEGEFKILLQLKFQKLEMNYSIEAMM